MARIKEERSVTGWKRVEYIKDALDLNNTEFREGFRNAMACQSNSFFTNAKKNGVLVKEVRRFARHVGIDYDLFFTEKSKDIGKFKRLVEKYREIKKYSPIDERVEKLTLDDEEEEEDIKDSFDDGDNEPPAERFPDEEELLEILEQSFEQFPEAESPAKEASSRLSNEDLSDKRSPDKEEGVEESSNRFSESDKWLPDEKDPTKQAADQSLEKDEDVEKSKEYPYKENSAENSEKTEKKAKARAPKNSSTAFLLAGVCGFWGILTESLDLTVMLAVFGGVVGFFFPNFFIDILETLENPKKR